MAILFTTVLIASTFIFFFDVGRSSQLSLSNVPSAPEVNGEDTVTMTFTIDEAERVPIEHVSLKLQRIDQNSGDLDIPVDIRFKPGCASDGSLRPLTGYGGQVNEASGSCTVTIGGQTTDADGNAYTVSDTLGYGYLLVRGTGYGYANLQNDEGNLVGGYGYRCNQDIVDQDGQHRCLDNQIDQQSSSTSRSSKALDSYFVLDDLESDIDQEVSSSTTNLARCDLGGADEDKCYGYGEGYGYNFQGKQNEVVLTWNVPVQWPSTLDTDANYQLVGVVWTGSQVLRTLQTPQSANIVNPAPESTDGGGGGDPPTDTGEDSVSKNVGGSKTFTQSLGDLNTGADVTLNFDGSDELMTRISFTVKSSISGASVHYERFALDDLPSGVDVPDEADARWVFELELRSGGNDVSDQVENLEIRHKVQDDWQEGNLADAPTRSPDGYPDGAIALGHRAADGTWSQVPTSPLSDSQIQDYFDNTAGVSGGPDLDTWNHFEALPGSLSFFTAGAFDENPPTFSNNQPTSTTTRRPAVSVDVADAGVGVANATLYLDGTEVDSATSGGTLSHTPTSDLSFGTHTARVTAEDHFGNNDSMTWDIDIQQDVEPPSIFNLEPARGAEVEKNVTISASYSDPGGVDLQTVTLTVDGEDVTSSADATESQVTYAPDGGFGPGDHDVNVAVSDLFGNEATESWSFTVKGGVSNVVLIIVGIIAVIAIAAVAAWYLLVYRQP